MHARRPALHAVRHTRKLRVKFTLGGFEVDTGFRRSRQVARGGKRHDAKLGAAGIWKKWMRGQRGIFVTRGKLGNASCAPDLVDAKSRHAPHGDSSRDGAFAHEDGFACSVTTRHNSSHRDSSLVMPIRRFRNQVARSPQSFPATFEHIFASIE